MNFENNIENIRTEVKVLKQRLENINKALVNQEKTLNLLNENTKLLLTEALNPKNNFNSVEEIMKRAFSKGKLPNILLH